MTMAPEEPTSEDNNNNNNNNTTATNNGGVENKDEMTEPPPSDGANAAATTVENDDGVVASTSSSSANDDDDASLDEKNDRGNDDDAPKPNTEADAEDEESSPNTEHETEAATSASTTAPAPPPPLELEPAAAATTPARSGFFSRLGSTGTTTTTATTASATTTTTSLFGNSFGTVYDRAQKRAAELREQAVTEVERLRQQQLEKQKLQQQQQEEEEERKKKEEEVVIPPSTGTLVEGCPVVNLKEKGEVSPEEVAQDMNQDVENEKASIKSSWSTTNSNTTKTTINSSINPVLNAFNIVRQTSAEAAKELIFPIDAFAAAASSASGEKDVSGANSRCLSPNDSSNYSSYSHDDDSSEGSDVSVEEEESEKEVVGDANKEKEVEKGKVGQEKKEQVNGGSHTPIIKKSGTNNHNGRPPIAATATATTTTTQTPTRFSAAFNATVGRFSRLKESASFDNAAPPPGAKAEVVVGGADRVGGLRHFQLDGILDMPPLPPSMPFGKKVSNDQHLPPPGPPGRDTLSMQTGGQWTMASNRGPNAVSAPPPPPPPNEDTITASPFLRAFSRGLSDAASTAAVSETASVDGSASVATSTTGKPPVASPKPTTGGKRSSYYEEAVKSVLQPGQRALFFGKGTMGVVLKPTYLASWRGKDGGGLLSPTTAAKKGGVFIDSLIPGGHAEKSGVVFVGDHVIKIGATNVENMTLEEVVKVIAETKRPNIMVLTSEHDVEVVDKEVVEGGSKEDAQDDSEGKTSCTKTKKCFVSPLDVAYGFANKLIAEGGDLGSHENAPQDRGGLKQVISRNSLLDEDEESVESADRDGEEEVCFKSPGKDEGEATNQKVFSSPGAPASVSDNDGEDIPATPCIPQSEPTDSDINTEVPESDEPPIQSINAASNNVLVDVETLSAYAAHRTNTHNEDVELQTKRSSLLKHEALFNSDIRSALRLSLYECVSDHRRYSFLEHFFKNYLSSNEVEMKASNPDQEVKVEIDDDDVTSSKNQMRLLELYVELCKFHDAIMICSVSDREKLLGYAREISARFLSDSSDRDCLPEYVAHLALGGTEKVHSVSFALRDEDDFFEMGNGGDGDGFNDIRASLEAFLSTQESFLSFLVSDDCARMRAYLRGCSPFLSVKPHMFLKTDKSAGEDEGNAFHNFMLHAILHLVCMKEDGSEDGKEDGNDNFIKNDALLFSSGKRNMGAPSLLCCAVFIMRSLQKSMEAAVEGLIEDGMTGGKSDNNRQVYSRLINDLQFFWEVYIAPACGSLSFLALSKDAQEGLDDVRRLLVSSVDKVVAEEKTSDDTLIREAAMAKMLSSDEVSSSVHSLAEALLREYTLKIYPNFCRHIFHYWACHEAKEFRFDGNGMSEGYLVTNVFNGLSIGWMNRFLRQMDFPHGISLHRPSPGTLLQQKSILTSASPDTLGCLHNGDVALVFGTSPEDQQASVQRFSCVSLQPDTTEDGPRTNMLLPEDIPPIFESYAEVPPFHERPFQGMLQDAKNNRVSIDGWEVSLTNFVIPSQSSGDSHDDSKWMYCVSLVLRKSSSNWDAIPKISERDIDNECVRELQHDDSFSQAPDTGFKSPLFYTEAQDGRSRKMKVSQDLKDFNSKLHEQKWSQQIGQCATIGLALISSRNVMSAMRETLSLLYDDVCSVKSREGERVCRTQRHLCQPLVDILGVLSNSQEVEPTSLSVLLDPYLAYTTSRWIQRPLSDQSDIFSDVSGQQLLQALPPVPLALAFVTLLLEQKVVFSSSRRGTLMSAFAMMRLLKPLKWAHLQVPLVPVSMMNELIHYPAPFMLGIPTDEKESAAILSTLPNDVTLVDLDVGRVILASVFANDASKIAEGESGEAVAGALRSQVLFLAESLGGAFGAAIYQSSWCSDSPLQVAHNEKGSHANQNADNFSEVLNICEEFVSELVSGIHSCCLWIGEKHNRKANTRSESAIIFDEDRFFHIKNLRAEGRYVPLIQKSNCAGVKSLSLDHFDLIFETFLRTQCLSTYISEGNKESMLFW